MSTGAVVIRWGTSVPGRESKALEVFGSAIEHFEQLAKTGRIHAHKEYFAVGGRAGGCMVIEGQLDELQKIAIEPETLALNAKAAAIVHDFEIQVYAGGTDQSVQEVMGLYMNGLQEIGYL